MNISKPDPIKEILTVLHYPVECISSRYNQAVLFKQGK
jgi:hypothetical protein